MKRLAIVPARGGSKRIPQKNIRSFCGKPIIDYILKEASKSELFDVIHVSTDDLTIAHTVGRLGYPPHFMRPSSLADDYVGVMPVIQYVVQEFVDLGQHFDEVWLLMACSPLVRASHLREASTLLASATRDQAVLAVTEYPAPIKWAFNLSPDSSLIPLNPGSFQTRSQDIERSFYDAGAFAGFSASTLDQIDNGGSDSGFLGYVLPRLDAIDIDTLDDWMIAEAMYRARKHQ